MMDKQLEWPVQMLTISRREALMGSVSIFVTGTAASAPTNIALAAIEPTTHSRFMRMSKLLINHQLRPDIGARIVAAAADRYKDLPAVLDSIIAIADRKQAAVAEDFIGDIPDGNLKDFSYWVIFAWYSGCSSEKADATVFTYEDALTFKTTADVVAIPSYCFSGSNGWSQTTVPLANMPKF
jgi:fructose 5-dehydrogenase small subunit